MLKPEQELRETIVDIGLMMWQKGWVASNDGNISVRLDRERLLCTPTGVSKGRMQPEDLIICDMQGRKIEGTRGCTTEIAMHTTIYALREDIRAVVHAHPPVSTGFAAAGRALDVALLPEVVVSLGIVPLAGYGLPGTTELTEPMVPLIPNHDALLMSNHGVVCYGEDLQQAFFRMETVEHFARISLIAELLGGCKALPRAEVDKLVQSRGRYGAKTREHTPEVPLCAEDVEPGRSPVNREEIVSLIDEVLRARGLV